MPALLTKPASIEEDNAPDPAWIKGKCSLCGRPLVLNTYSDSKGFYNLLQCWGALQFPQHCTIENHTLEFGDGSEEALINA